VLKDIGVELSSYHGGSLNGKDFKKVMNFVAIFKEGKREECLLADADIDLMCLHFWEVYVLWDGSFSFARMINLTDVLLVVLSGSTILQCPITPKVHTMLRHVQWQMVNFPGGFLGDKMEDWVKCLHQWGIHQGKRLRTVQDPIVHALSREKTISPNMHPNVLAQVDVTDVGNKQKLSDKKADVISTR
jgi:hypothetical protein